MIVCFKFFEKIILGPSLVPTPYLPHFLSLVFLNDLKPDGCHQLGLYKTSLYSTGKDVWINDLKA